MYCPQCGAVNDDGAGTCGLCGYDLNKYKEQWREDHPGQEAGAPPAGGAPGSPAAGAAVPGGMSATGTTAGPGYQQGPYQGDPYQRPYQAPPYQQVPYPGTYQSPPYAPYAPGAPYGQMPPRIPSYLGWAIAVFILCFWPTGIVALVYASQVDNKLIMGDIAGAQHSSRQARLWCWITFWIAVAGIVIAIIGIVVALAVFGTSTGTTTGTISATGLLHLASGVGL